MNNQRVNAAATNVLKAGNQMNNAARMAATGQPGNATRMANAATGNLISANQRLNAEAMKAKELGNVNVANKLKLAANAARRAEINKALGHIAAALNASKGRSNAN
jgi:hypothetical protein